MSHSTLTPLTITGFRSHLTGITTYRVPEATCAHHTWSPDTSEWNGLTSMEGIRRYHMDARGFSDIAANFYVGPDGFIWTARPLDRDNWAHAYISKSWSQVHADAKALAYPDQGWLNKYAVGFEIVGNYDEEDPTQSATVDLAAQAFAAVHEQWNIPIANLLAHRMVADKSCPGNRFDLNWFAAQVGGYMGNTPVDPKAVTVLDPCGNEVEGRHWLGEDGRTYGPIANSVRAIDGDVETVKWTAEEKIIQLVKASE